MKYYKMHSSVGVLLCEKIYTMGIGQSVCYNLNRRVMVGYDVLSMPKVIHSWCRVCELLLDDKCCGCLMLYDINNHGNKTVL